MKVQWEQTSFEGLEAPRKRRKPRGVEKGNPFAGKVAAFLGLERRVLNGSKDKGDLATTVTTIEVKCPGRDQPVRLSAAMAQVKKAAQNAGTRYFGVITRRTGYPVDEAFFTVPLWQARERGWIE